MTNGQKSVSPDLSFLVFPPRSFFGVYGTMHASRVYHGYFFYSSFLVFAPFAPIHLVLLFFVSPTKEWYERGGATFAKYVYLLLPKKLDDNNKSKQVPKQKEKVSKRVQQEKTYHSSVFRRQKSLHASWYSAPILARFGGVRSEVSLTRLSALVFAF